MTKKKNNTVSVEDGQKADVKVIDLRLVAPDRNRKDVGKLKAAIERAESITLPNRYKLMDLYHDVVTIDGHLDGILEKRTKSVTNKRLRFLDKDGKKVEASSRGSLKFSWRGYTMDALQRSLSLEQSLTSGRLTAVTSDLKPVR